MPGNENIRTKRSKIVCKEKRISVLKYNSDYVCKLLQRFHPLVFSFFLSETLFREDKATGDTTK